jgi:hypothetical protein
MAQNKYQIIEFKPTANQVGMSHSFYAQAVVDNVITNRELAKKIEAKDAGATGWIIKPFVPAKLLAAISKVIR